MTEHRPMFPPRAESIHAFPVQPVVEHPQFSSLFRRLSEHDPRDVIAPRAILTELFQEELHPDPEWMADLVIQRLHDGGFTIMPTKEVNHG